MSNCAIWPTKCPNGTGAGPLSAGCGLRWGEVVELRRSDVEPRRQGHHRGRGASTHRDKQCHIDRPKSGRRAGGHRAPEFLRADLLEHLDKHVGDLPNALVFTKIRTDQGNCHHVNDRAFAKTWFKPAMTTVDMDEIPFHGLRHFAGKVVSLVGGSTQDAKRRLGHTSSKAAEGLSVSASMAATMRLPTASTRGRGRSETAYAVDNFEGRERRLRFGVGEAPIQRASIGRGFVT